MGRVNSRRGRSRGQKFGHRIRLAFKHHTIKKEDQVVILLAKIEMDLFQICVIIVARPDTSLTFFESGLQTKLMDRFRVNRLIEVIIRYIVKLVAHYILVNHEIMNMA